MKNMIKFLSVLLCFSFLFALCSCGVENKEETTKEEKEKIDFSSYTYMVFGDSITYGAEYSNGYSQMETPYNEAVKNLLNLKSTINKGVSGATYTSNNLGLVSMSNVITSTNEEADIISVMGGVNDFNRNLPLGNNNDRDITTIYGALHTTMNFLKENYPNAYIFYMTPYKEDYSGMLWSRDNNQGYNLEDVSNAIKEVALFYEIDVLDLFTLGGFELVMNNPDCDGIHPNQDFILEKTAPQIATFIEMNFNK